MWSLRSLGRNWRSEKCDDAIVSVFNEIRRLFKDLPNLVELGVSNGTPFMDTMAAAVMEEKETGKPFDARDLWLSQPLSPCRPHPQSLIT